MKTQHTQPQQQLQRVAENLYKSQSSGRYYALLKSGGKQIRKSLKTADRKLAERKLAGLRDKVSRLTSTEGKNLLFAEYDKDNPALLIGGISKRWLDSITPRLKPSTLLRRTVAIKSLSRFFRGLTVRNIGLRQVEAYLMKRSKERNPQTVNIEVETLRGILGYAVAHGMILDNPAAGIKRLRITQKPITCPTREQFVKILSHMRTNEGKRDAEQSADVVEFLGYSGWRLGEAGNLQWQHVNMELGQITIAGDPETGPKNRKAKTVPMSPPLMRLIQRLRDALPQPPQPTDKVLIVANPRKGMDTATTALRYPHFSVHSLRHFFVTNAIECGLDFRVIAGLVNHSDGGALLAKRYAHLRDAHLAASVKKLTFDAAAEEPANVIRFKTAANE